MAKPVTRWGNRIFAAVPRITLLHHHPLLRMENLRALEEAGGAEGEGLGKLTYVGLHLHPSNECTVVWPAVEDSPVREVAVTAVAAPEVCEASLWGGDVQRGEDGLPQLGRVG